MSDWRLFIWYSCTLSVVSSNCPLKTSISDQMMRFRIDTGHQLSGVDKYGFHYWRSKSPSEFAIFNNFVKKKKKNLLVVQFDVYKIKKKKYVHQKRKILKLQSKTRTKSLDLLLSRFPVLGQNITRQPKLARAKPSKNQYEGRCGCVIKSGQ